MCLLAVYLAGALPNAAALSCAASRNPDGFGWAIVSGGEIVSHKTMDPSEGVESFLEARGKHLEGPAFWHARFTTHGTTDLYNVHPFPVARDPRVVLAHNGILPIAPQGKRSDTHELCETMLRPSDLDNDSAMFWLGEWARGSKLAILSASPDTARDLYIVNECDGHWLESEPGVWYSNKGYLPVVAPSFSPDPRVTSSKGGGLYASSGGLYVPDHVVGDPAGDPWELWEDHEIVECDTCGELWPEFVDYCDTCGTPFLDGLGQGWGTL